MGISIMQGDNYLAPYTLAPHLLLASPNGLHKLTVDDNGNVLVDGKKIGTPTETA